RHVPQAHEAHYSHEEEDFAKGDSSELDVWVFRRLQMLLASANGDAKLHAELHGDRVVIFCHYLGIDSNGHAHRPNSNDYLNNIKLVDELVEKTYRLIEEFYDYDERTAYVFTADHGMSLKGAHGDGDPANTRTPLVAWGAGVQGPILPTKPGDPGFEIDLPTQSRAQVRAQLQAQEQQEHAALNEWGTLAGLVRKDVMQADVAPLISALLGLPYPRNSVGVLPFSYLAKGAYRANAVRSNAQQLYLHALRKEQEKRTRTLLHFAPYGPFHSDVPELTRQLDEAYDSSRQSDSLEDTQSFQQVEALSQELIEICLATLEYFQRYDWFFLLSIIVLGYVGWMLVVAVAYLHPRDFRVRWLLGVEGQQLDVKLVVILFAAFTYLALESSPLTYFLYVLFPLLFGNFAWNHKHLLQQAWLSASSKQPKSSGKRWLEAVLILVCLELVVLGYERREIFGVLFSLLALWPILGGSPKDSNEAEDRVQSGEVRGFPSPSRCWSMSCLLISVFPYLPSEYGEHTVLVHTGGLLTLLFAALVLRSTRPDRQRFGLTPAFGFEAVPLVLSLLTLYGTMQYLDGDRSKPPFVLTVANWLLAIVPVLLLLFRLQHGQIGVVSGLEIGSERRQETAEVTRYIARLVEMMLAFAPSFTLLSIAYEVLFYVALCGVLVSWLLLEAQRSSASMTSSTWREIQRAFVFLLLIKIAFFGTGNVASMSSFEISSTYRFVTVFAPFTMGALLVLKILIPFMLVACTFHLILLLPSAPLASTSGSEPRLPATRYFLLVVAMSDVLALHFLFLVKNEGSWKEIGNSISMFGIVNAQIVFIPLLFLLALAFVRDLAPSDSSSQSLKEKKRQ
ncbi:hypothetical protein BBJ28_00009213, partial [Nothophytophthora sp. Chile5]